MKTAKLKLVPSKSAPRFKPIIGVEPKEQRLPVDLIEIDRRTQRDAKHDKIAKFARNWNWNVYQNISVSKRSDGRFYCYDGQNRLLAAKMRGDIPSLLCSVRPMTIEEEADSFVGINNDRSKVNSADKHRVGVIGTDNKAREVQAILDKYDIAVVEKQFDENSTTGLSVIYKMAFKNGGRKQLEIMLAAIRKYWKGDKYALSSRFIDGFSRTMSKIEGYMLTEKDYDDFFRIVSAHDAEFYIRKAEAYATQFDSQLLKMIPYVMLERYRQAGGVKEVPLERLTLSKK